MSQLYDVMNDEAVGPFQSDVQETKTSLFPNSNLITNGMVLILPTWECIWHIFLQQRGHLFSGL